MVAHNILLKPIFSAGTILISLEQFITRAEINSNFNEPNNTNPNNIIFKMIEYDICDSHLTTVKKISVCEIQHGKAKFELRNKGTSLSYRIEKNSLPKQS